MADPKLYVLDTSAVLALRGDEPGADRVAAVLRTGTAGHARVLASFMTRMEMLYRIACEEGQLAAEHAVRLLSASGVEWVSCDEEILLEAARIKTAGGLSVADAWIAATARCRKGLLLHKDPEFDVLTDILQEKLA